MASERADTWASIPQTSWMDRFYSDHEVEEAEERLSPIFLVPWDGRLVIWNLSMHLHGESSYGVSGQACQLLERYLAIRLRGYSEITSESEKQQITDELSSKILLLACVCIQLSAKMNSAYSYVNAHSLQRYLQRQEMVYSLNEINATEAAVFSTIGFKIPLWNNVEKALLLATELSMCSNGLMEILALVVDVAEFYRTYLQQRIRGIAFGTQSASTSRDGGSSSDSSHSRLGIDNIRNMHLAAASVAAAGLFMRYSGPDPVYRLAALTRCPADYIRCICDAIVHFLILIKNWKRPDDAESSSSDSKRRRIC